MSRGLGKWERFVMDALTFPTYSKNYDKFYLFPYDKVEELVALYLTTGNGNTSPEDCGGTDVDPAYSRLDKKQRCAYQSICRAVRSLENKGFIKSEKVAPDPLEKKDFADDGVYLKDRKKVSFNVKCLAKGIPWQLKYLNKRLVKIKRGDYD